MYSSKYPVFYCIHQRIYRARKFACALDRYLLRIIIIYYYYYYYYYLDSMLVLRNTKKNIMFWFNAFECLVMSLQWHVPTDPPTLPAPPPPHPQPLSYPPHPRRSHTHTHTLTHTNTHIIFYYDN